MAILFRRSNGIYYLAPLQNNQRVWRSTGARRRTEAGAHVRSLALPKNRPSS